MFVHDIEKLSSTYGYKKKKHLNYILKNVYILEDFPVDFICRFHLYYEY